MTEMKLGEIDLPPEPKHIGDYDDMGRGSWYAGSQPKQGGDNPVIVFVPGYGGSPKAFYADDTVGGMNYLYAYCYADGFRTAFVGFNRTDEKPFDIWQDGKIFAWQLEEICRYFNTDRVVVVAHSKGGVDSQTAGVYFGASPRISRLITLSSPHWGSQLADLAYSTIGWELAEMLGQHNDGSFSMQTAYMQMYRKATDKNPLNNLMISTFAGNGNAPVFSELWAGKQFLSLYGDNDGVVTVKNAKNPRGEHIATLPYNHMEIVMGQNIWRYLKPVVLGNKAAVPLVSEHAEIPYGTIFRGGRLDNGVADEFPVDSTVTSMEICIVLSVVPGGQGEFHVYTPGGNVYKNFETAEGQGGVKTMRMIINAPQTGNWHILCEGLSGAYFMRVKLSDTFIAAPGSSGSDFSYLLRVFKTGIAGYRISAEHVLRPKETRTPIHIEADGAYSVESVIRGVLSDGSAFERNILRPVIAGEYNALKKTGIFDKLF